MKDADHFRGGTCAGRRVAVPQRVYLIDNGHLSYYSSVTDKVAVRTSLPRANANQQALSLQLVVYSTAQAAWLLFFRVMTSAGAPLLLVSLFFTKRLPLPAA